MQKNCFKAIVLGLFAVCGTVGVQQGKAQSLQLVTITTPWRYNQSGADLGTPWRTTNYVDTIAGWEGPGLRLFGFETTPTEYPYVFNTPFVDPTTVNPSVITYYFRDIFNIPNYTPTVRST